MHGLRNILLIGSVLLFGICSVLFLKMEDHEADEHKTEELKTEELKTEELKTEDGSMCLSETVPSVFITTRSGSLSYIEAAKGNSESGFLSVFSENGEQVYYGQIEELKGRGNTSWDAPKKSFNLELSSEASFLGMQAAENWILTANYYDGAYIRNALGFWLADEAGSECSIDSRFVDLYVNGEYRGLYQLMERVKTAAERGGFTKGWLLEMDYPERAVYENSVLYLENGQPVAIHDPKNVSDSRMEMLGDWFAEMKRALYADDYVNPDTGKGIFEYLDLESFARKYLLEEVLLNMDMGVTSHYLYLDESGKLYEGPLWDLDNALGRGNYNEEELLALQGDPARNQMLRWYIRLCGNDIFYEAVQKEWRNNVYPALKEMEEKADGMLEMLEESIRMDQKRWPGSRSMTMPNTDLDYNAAYLKEYISGRTEVLYQAFSENSRETEEQMKKRAAALPEEAEIEPYAEAEETDGEIEEAGFKETLLAGHGMLSLLLLLAVLGILAAADRRRIS